MKLSLKLQDNHHQKQEDQNQQLPFLLRAKIPVTIFNLPFLSSFSTTTHHPSDVSLSLSTNFTSGPSLKLTYSTTTTTSTTTSSAPLTLTLKSGTGLFGSPKACPLVISANFSFSPQNPNPNPTFSLLLKPHLGSFSLRKRTCSNPEGGFGGRGKVKDDGNSFGFVPLDRPGVFKDFLGEESGKDPVFKGVLMMARTELPVEKRFSAYVRWGVRFPGNFSNGTMLGMPYLSVNKIGIEKVDEVKEDGIEKKQGSNGVDVEMLRGLCSWMKREMDGLQMENRDMKMQLEELKMGHMRRNLRNRGSGGGGVTEGVGSKVVSPVFEGSGGYEQWKNKKNEADGGKKNELKKNGNSASDVESELQKAIMAASSS